MDYKWLSYVLFSIISFIVLEKFAQYIFKQLSPSENINVFCEQFIEETEGGSYYYREAFEDVNLTLIVIPIAGDPDLYISYTNRPTYLLENHDQNSCTCGVEELKSINELRPIYIGVYCYNTNVDCLFKLSICSPLKQTSTLVKNSKITSIFSVLKSTVLYLIKNLSSEIIPGLF